jgi:hypothetical protein
MTTSKPAIPQQSPHDDNHAKIRDFIEDFMDATEDNGIPKLVPPFSEKER